MIKSIFFLIGTVTALHFGENCVVRCISTEQAITVLQKWSLEIQVSSPVFDATDKFMTTVTEENNSVQNINKISSWLAQKKNKKKKGVFVSLIDDNEKMMAFTEQKNNYIQVNGFLSCPFIETETHLIARSNIALELLDIASQNEENIAFVFDTN
tara:strand:+ start:14495 stop:14959 length:465 start_codon:yes stop_codon:yes gene_type:complete